MSWYEAILIGYGLNVLSMLSLWLWQLRSKNAGVVDLGWASGLGVFALTYALSGPAPGGRRLLIAGMVGFWSYRLCSHLLSRDLFHGIEEERYAKLREYWGEKFNRNAFFFFQGQALLNLTLSLPFFLACWSSDPHLGLVEALGILVFWLGLFGETMADEQLRRFKLDTFNRGKVCKDGLWRYSRHPNYFFEWVLWVGFFLSCSAHPYWFLGIWSPVVMLFLLMKVTGVPPSEAQSLRSRGELYRQYQQETSEFFPWFAKVNPTAGHNGKKDSFEAK